MIPPNRLIVLALVLTMTMLSACAGTKKVTPYQFKNYIITPQVYSDPPRTVAILPFSNLIKDSKLTVENWKKVAQNKYFDISQEQKRTEEYLKRLFVRRAFYKHFSVKPFRDKELIEVDQLLKEHEIEWAEDLIDKEPQEIAELLGVDALIYGEITHLNRIYLGLYSEVSVGVNLKMYDARKDEFIWKMSDVEKSRAGGASLSLTGLATSLLDATLNMRKIWVYRVADDLFRRMTGYLPDLEVAIEPQLMVAKEKAVLYSAPGLMGSSFGGKKIKKLPVSTPLTLIEEADSWYHVKTVEGGEGWIEPSYTVLSGKELGRPFDVRKELKDKDYPTDTELAGLYDLRGMEHFKNKRFNDAVASLKKALRYDKNNPSIHFHLAWALKLAPDLEESAQQKSVTEHLEQAATLSPDNVNYHYSLGLAYYEQNLAEEAIAQWKKCLELDPSLDNAKTLLELAKAQLNNTQTQEDQEKQPVHQSE